MEPEVRRRYEKGLAASLTWDPVSGGKRSLVTFTDREERNFGPDLDQRAFEQISTLMLSGNYYPPEVIETFWEGKGRRDWRPGDRVLQRVKLPLGISLWSMVEIFRVEKTDELCAIGYVTTSYHHGRGIWQAQLTWEAGGLKMIVEGTASPQSWLFWLGLPYARHMQRRAWRKALDRFGEIARVN